MRKFTAFLVSAALVVAGCGDASGGEPGAAAAAQPSPSTTPSAVPTVDRATDRATVQARATAALMAQDAVLGIDGYTFLEEDQKPYSYDNFCGRGVTADRAGTAARSRRAWNGEATNLYQVVHANAVAPGTAVVEQIRTNMSGCVTYRETCPSHCAAITVLGPLDPGPLAGVEGSVGSCEKWEPIGKDVYIRCVAYLARGTTVSNVQVNGWTHQAAVAMMKKVVPIAAAALARA